MLAEEGGVGLDLAAWMRSRRRDEVGERGANITDLLVGRSSWGVRGEAERVEGGVTAAAGEGGEGTRGAYRFGLGLELEFRRHYRPPLAEEDSHRDHVGLQPPQVEDNLAGCTVGWVAH